MTQLNPQKLFLSRFYALAKLAGMNLDDDVVELYDESLKHLGHMQLAQAIEHLIRTRRSRDPFPSIREIAEILAPVEDDQSIAVDVASRIYAAISKHGHNWYDKAKADWPAEPLRVLGEVGWEVVKQRGGWTKICEDSNTEEAGIMTAQLRDLAKSTLKRARSGTLAIAPSLPQPTLTRSPQTGFSHLSYTIPQKEGRMLPAPNPPAEKCEETSPREQHKQNGGR